jgi:Protein of unknown function (DUF3618)
MDQEQSKAGREVAGEQDRTPEQVHQEIEQTRAELGDTVASLAEKADVKGQAKQAVNEAKDTVSGKVSDVTDTVVGKKDEFVSSAREATPDTASQGGQRVASVARENPVPLAALGFFALGFLIGKRVGR